LVRLNELSSLKASAALVPYKFPSDPWTNDAVGNEPLIELIEVAVYDVAATTVTVAVAVCAELALLVATTWKVPVVLGAA